MKDAQFAMGAALVLLLSATFSPLLAQETAPPPETKTIQEGDIPETLLPFEPIEKETEQDKNRREATARYMNGLVLQKRGQFQEAMKEFQEALKADPDAVEVYRSLIVLAIRFNQRAAAQALLVEGLKRAPNDFEFLRLLGALRQDLKQIPQAIEAFEKAAESPEVDKKSQEYVVLMMELGLLHRVAGNKEKAADAYEVVFEAALHPERFHLNQQAISLIRTNAELSFERIGSVFLEAERFDLALKAFEEAEKNPKIKPEEISFFKAQIHHAQDKHEEALAELQKYLDKNLQSQGIEPYKLLAEILTSLERADEIEPTLDKLYDTDANNNFIVYALADRYRQNDEFAKAIELYLKAIGRGADPEGYKGLMDVYYSQGRADDWLGALSGLLGLGKEVEGLEEQFKQVADDKEFMDKLVVSANELHAAGSRKFGHPEAYILGRLSASAKRTPDVIHFYKLAIQFRQTRGPQLLGELSDYLIQNEQYAEVETLMEESLKAPADNRLRTIYGQILAQALLPLSFDLEQAGKQDVALEKIRRANEVLPNNTLLRYRLGWLEYRNQHLAEAIAIFESVIGTADYTTISNDQLRNIVKQSHFLLSAIYVQEGKIERGQELLEVIYKNEPDDPSVNNDLGYLYADQNIKLEQAEKMIRLALKAEPENHAYLDSLGWVLFRQGKFDEAVEYLLKAVEGSEDGDATLWDHLGDVYAKQGNAEKAKEAWTTALKQAEGDDRRDEKLIEKIREKLGQKAEVKPLEAPRPATAE